MQGSPRPTAPSRNARVLLVFARAIVAYGAFFLTMYWVEAEKEARVLCGLSKTGSSAREVDRTFGTANLLRVRSDSAGARRTLHVASAHNLHLSGCTLTIEGGVVTDWSYAERLRSGAVAPLVLLLGLLWLVVRHGRNAFAAVTSSTANAERRFFRGRWFAVAGEIVPALLVLLAITALLDHMQVVSLPSLTPYSGVLGALLLLVFIAEFVIAPARGTAPVQRAAERLFPLVMACMALVVLLGG